MMRGRGCGGGWCGGSRRTGRWRGTFRLPPLQGAVLVKALRAAAGDLEHTHEEEPGVSAETPAASQPVVATSSSLADALLVVAEAFLARKVAARR